VNSNDAGVPSFAFLDLPCYPPAISKNNERHMNTESKSRVVYENLDTTFVNLWALLRKLSQSGFIGRVRVELKDYTADVFMTGSSTPLVHEVDHSAGTDTLEEAALHRLVLRARETPGTISVFEGPDEAVAVGGPASDTGVPLVTHPPEARASGTGVPPVNRPQDTQATIEPGVEAPSMTIHEPALEELSRTETDEAELLPPPASPVTAPAFEPTEIEWISVVKTSGELIGAVERALTGLEANFDSLFRAVRIELADDYTFLDPMSDGFQYWNSVVTLTGDPSLSSYVAGLSEALRRVVDRVATGERARRVRERVALELFSVARKRQEILAQAGFRAQLDRIAGTKVI
jgi:hypothetical protein